jgi:AsmA-like C-terminal region
LQASFFIRSHFPEPSFRERTPSEIGTIPDDRPFDFVHSTGMEQSVRPILKWMIVLMLLTSAAAGGGAYWFYIRSDDLLRNEVIKLLADVAPDLRFGIERANFDLTGRIRLQGLAIQLPGESEPALYIPETIITLDEDKLTSFDNVTIRRFRFVQPRLHAARSVDGRWNWQGILVRCDAKRPLPDVEIEHGSVVVELQRNHKPARVVKLNNINFTGIPAAARRMKVALSTRIDPAGPISATGEIDLSGGPWKIEAKWQRLPVDEELLELAGDLSPTVAEKLQTVRTTMSEMAAKQIATVSIPIHSTTEISSETSPPATRMESRIESRVQSRGMPIGLSCLCDLHVRVQQANGDAPIELQSLAQLQSGQVSNALLPFPLYELRGSLYVDRQQVILRDVRAENGSFRVSMDGKLAPDQPPNLSLHVQDLEIDDAVKARLPESTRKVLNSLGLTGRCDLDIESRQDDGRLFWEGTLKLKNGIVTHEKFPYPIREISGTATLREGRIDVEGHGMASGIPVRLITGWVTNPGPENECLFVIQADNAPINSTLLAACPPAIRKALAELNLQGRHDVRLQISKAAGLGERYKPHAAIKLQDCSCSFKGFPYLITRLQGLVIWDDDEVTFRELRGIHDATVLTGFGTFARTPSPGHLDLTIRAENAAFDRSLEAALPRSLASLWQEFHPVGHFDVESKISWTPGRPCEVTLPRISVADTEITMRNFPWPLQSVKGEFSYEPPLFRMKSFHAQHDDTQIRGRGSAMISHGKPWKVLLDELHVDDLSPNVSFRAALPQRLKNVCDTLNPTGKISISTNRTGSVILTGGGNPPEAFAAKWDVQLLLSDCDVNAGIRIEDIHGRINLKGETDSRTTVVSNQLDLDSISIFRQASGLAHQITRVQGPIRFQDGQLIAGSRTLFASTARTGSGAEPRTSEESIRGEAIDGTLTLDAVADLRKQPEFRLGVTLSRGRLERYAQQYLRGQSDLAGLMNGWIQIAGNSNGEPRLQGRGALQIAPAALYELPLIVQIFRTLQLDATDRRAFDRADLIFKITDSRFNFETIDLVGKPISLRGRGYVRFDGTMQFDFYSMLARSQVRIPVIHEIAGALSRGWVGVKITGSIGAPQTRNVPLPEFDDALKQFLGTFDPAGVLPIAQPNPRNTKGTLMQP